MSKARARERAKAKAARQGGQKPRKPADMAGPAGPKAGAAAFDPGAGSIKKPGAGAAGRSFSEMRRGASRSR